MFFFLAILVIFIVIILIKDSLWIVGNQLQWRGVLYSSIIHFQAGKIFTFTPSTFMEFSKLLVMI